MANGLYLFVSTGGGRSWRLDYTFQSKRKTLSLGQYPVLGLADARKKRDEAKRLLLDGIDPGEVKKQIRSYAYQFASRRWPVKNATQYQRRP